MPGRTSSVQCPKIFSAWLSQYLSWKKKLSLHAPSRKCQIVMGFTGSFRTVAVQHRTCLRSSFRCVKFRGSPWMSGKYVGPQALANTLIRRDRIFAKIACYIHVCPPVRISQSGSHWTDLSEIWYRELLWKSVDEVQILLKMGGKYIWGTLREELSTFSCCRRH